MCHLQATQLLVVMSEPQPPAAILGVSSVPRPVWGSGAPSLVLTLRPGRAASPGILEGFVNIGVTATRFHFSDIVGGHHYPWASITGEPRVPAMQEALGATHSHSHTECPLLV